MVKRIAQCQIPEKIEIVIKSRGLFLGIYRHKNRKKKSRPLYHSMELPKANEPVPSCILMQSSPRKQA